MNNEKHNLSIQPLRQGKRADEKGSIIDIFEISTLTMLHVEPPFMIVARPYIRNPQGISRTRW